MPLPKRKHPRLKNYDYGSTGVYFITACTKNHTCCLCNINIVGRDDPITPPDDPITPPDENVPTVTLTDMGKVVDKYINSIGQSYDNVFVKKYVIMPDHIHLLIYIKDTDYGVTAITNGTENPGVMRSSRPTVPIIIKGLKRMVTREIGYSIWQKSFFDEIIRNEEAYRNVWNYIDANPREWVNDSLNR